MVPTRTAITCWRLSLLTMMGWLLVLTYSATLPVTLGDALVNCDSQSVMKSVNLLLVVHPRCLLTLVLVLRRLLIPAPSAAVLGYR